MTIKDFIQSTNKKTQRIHKEKEERNGAVGVGGTDLPEDIPPFNILSCEKVIKGQNNSWIVLGRDRPAGKDSGRVGKGSTQSGMIDLCVGRLSAMPKGGLGGFMANRKQEQQLADPDFSSDAARVYLTQKGHIDEYFGLVKGSEDGKNAAKDRSAIGIKADHVRIVGKSHIKIVTGRAEVSGAGKGGERLSTGGKNERAGRIDFIAGNYTHPKNVKTMSWFIGGNSKEKMESLQPIPKGDNLVEFCTDLMEVVSDLVGFCHFNSRRLNQLTKAVGSHFHPIGAVGPVPIATPCPPLEVICTVISTATLAGSNFRQKQTNYNLGSLEMTYLTKGAASKYINSSHVNTT